MSREIHLSLAPFLQRRASNQTGENLVKQRFLNQKFGKRISRKASLHKANLSVAGAAPRSRPAVPGRNPPPGKPA